ncbi:MAG: hypothetical protein ABH818_03170 [Patescibacteria group bacterium]|nr:hypothetical protein [Patescibacteria group bacterium]
MENIDNRLLNNTLKPEEEDGAAGALREARRGNDNKEDSGGDDESLREKVMEARKKADLKKDSPKTGEDELTKQVSAQVLNYLWSLTASGVGAIPGFLVLNAIAFLKAVKIDLFGIVKKIKFRLRDKMGLVVLDAIVLFCLIAIIGVIMIILEYAEKIFGWLDFF